MREDGPFGIFIFKNEPGKFKTVSTCRLISHNTQFIIDLFCAAVLDVGPAAAAVMCALLIGEQIYLNSNRLRDLFWHRNISSSSVGRSVGHKDFDRACYCIPCMTELSWRFICHWIIYLVFNFDCDPIPTAAAAVSASADNRTTTKTKPIHLHRCVANTFIQSIW